jgi:serine/threonine protein kinase/Tol biopolymer transport system component
MSLTPGTRLGPYEIIAAIGAGGMGEVYRARDTRLERTVAIKVLPDSFALDAGLRERFAREAKVISSLDHPNICVLHDVGDHDGTAFLVMQYLEGDTLEQRLAAGPLPIDQALRYAIEISDALDRAHRQGIVHRDLKPGNIILTKTGAKVLDFGLAKVGMAGGAALGVTGLPTTPPNITAHGAILGTFQYMAPEQLEGNEADARTDIFGFGAVLYEMVTGKRAFAGKSQASLISAIMSGTPPPISAVQPLTPPGLDRVVKKCLAKDPDERWQTAHDLKDELKWVAERSALPVPAGSGVLARTTSVRRSRVAWTTVAILGIALMTVGVLWGREHLKSQPDASALIKFETSFPDGWGIAPVSAAGYSTAPVAVSPDGRRVAFVAIGPNKKTQIWMRPLDSLSAQPLAGTAGAGSPFWSPDSRFLGFFADGSLKKIDVAGGPAVTLCPAAENMGGTWGTSGVIVFSPGAGALQKVSTAGGVPAPATRLATGETLHWRPSFLPDGRHFIYRSNTPNQKGPFYIASLDSTDSTLVLNADSSNAIYSQGHLLFMLGSTLMAQPFDSQRLEMAGEPVPVAEQVLSQASSVPNGIFSASANGVLAYTVGASFIGSELIWFDRAGKEISKLGEPARYSDVELSPDGQRLAVSVRDQVGAKSDLWIFDVARNFRSRFTSDPQNELGGRWTPDGRNIAYQIDSKGIFLKPSGSSTTERRLLENTHTEYPDSWTPDQRALLYEVDDPKTSWDLWVLPVAEGSKPYPFIQAPLRQEYGRISPDGRWVAYRSTESGRDEIYVVPFPGPGDKVQLSTSGGIYPRWRRDGKEIFYIDTNSRLMAAPVDGGGPQFKVGQETRLFDVRLLRGDWPYDVSGDGQRFIVGTRVEQSSSAPLTVVVNWTAGLRK